MMGVLAVGLASVVVLTAETEPEHAANPVYRTLVDEGIKLKLGGSRVALPAPSLHDGQSANAQRAALRAIAGSDGAVEDLLRNSVTAPLVVTLRDEPAGGGDLIRRASVWFVIHAELDRIDLAEEARKARDDTTFEAANMRVEVHRLPADALKTRGMKEEARGPGQAEWSAHLKARLLDRIGFEVTGRSFASKSANSMVVGSQTMPAFDQDRDWPNRWWPIVLKDGRETDGPARPYAGGAGYVKASKLTIRPGAILVEAHFAFLEPKAWFQGQPVLRSKLNVVAQDRVRRLRRALAKSPLKSSKSGK